jgi:hypothetical protein
MSAIRGTAGRLAGFWLSGLALGLVMQIPANATPDLSGVWQVTSRMQELRTTDGQAPPLRPEAQRTYDERRKLWRAGDLSFDPTAKCVSPGLPRILFLPYPFEIIQRPKRITYLFAWNYWNRHVDMSGQKLEAPYPLALGESGGHWEGETLVIDTDGLRADNTMLDSAGMPHTESLHVTERLRLLHNGAKLEDLIRIEDPKTFTKPWDTRVEFRKLPTGTEIPLDICLDRVDAGKPAVDWSRPLSQ